MKSKSTMPPTLQTNFTKHHTTNRQMKFDKHSPTKTLQNIIWSRRINWNNIIKKFMLPTSKAVIFRLSVNKHLTNETAFSENINGFYKWEFKLHCHLPEIITPDNHGNHNERMREIFAIK